MEDGRSHRDLSGAESRQAEASALGIRAIAIVDDAPSIQQATACAQVLMSLVGQNKKGSVRAHLVGIAPNSRPSIVVRAASQ
jgi:hypothetical protein